MILRTLARAAAAQTGLPVCVLVIEPGANWSMIASRPITAEIGSELLMPLPQQMRSGRDAVVLERPELAGAAEPRLHLVEGQHDAVLAAPLAQAGCMNSTGAKSGPTPW